ncbi:MAG TPA: hypothetical protein VN924_08215 [Bryobacteraceae bacterium]|nr:hypothetical protein [Bryobacteraceae bacterium]
MKIFVVGSSRHLNEKEQDRVTGFRVFCQALAKSFADNGWTVLVGSLDRHCRPLAASRDGKRSCRRQTD